MKKVISIDINDYIVVDKIVRFWMYDGDCFVSCVDGHEYVIPRESYEDLLREALNGQL